MSKLYLEGKSILFIAQKYGSINGTVYSVLLRNNVEIRTRAEARINYVKLNSDIVQKSYFPLEKDEICKDYINGISTPALARKYDMNNQTIYEILVRNGVTVRSREEARINYVKLNTEGHIENSPTVSKSEVAFFATLEAILNVIGARQVYLKSKCFDWVNYDKKVIVEVDCAYWHTNEKDIEKDIIAEQCGFKLIRVNCDKVLHARQSFENHRKELEFALL